jgi:hypothetical protein
MGSGALIYVPSFIKIGSVIQKLIRAHRQTHTDNNVISWPALFFQNKGSRLKMDLREIGWSDMDWIDLAQNRGQWRALVNTVMNLRVP